MSLKANLATLQPTKPRSLKDWLNTATPEDAELVLTYIRNEAIAPGVLAATLRENGVPVTPNTIKLMRSGGTP